MGQLSNVNPSSGHPKRPLTESLRRYSGRRGKRNLVEAIRLQTLVSGDSVLATAICNCGLLQEHDPGDVLLRQGEPDNDILLIVAGEVSIKVNERQVASRSAGTHVGEMALIDRLAKRSATVTATEPTITLRLPEHKFSKVADEHSELWRRIAVEVAKRLRERNKALPKPHDKPVLFIGSSTEGLAIANEVHNRFSQKPLVPRLWSEGVFQASSTSIESLVSLAQDSDFAALVLTSDDVTISRGRSKPSPRDNVIFELGLFMGALGRDRVFVIKPRGLDIRIPSDLFGVTWLEYLKGGPKPLRSRLQPACKRMLEVIVKIGPR